MREIKFRMWIEEQKEMLYPEIGGYTSPDNYKPLTVIAPDACDQTYNWLIVWNGESDKKEVHLIEPSVRMQFTGLNDREGKEIYEGDIVVGLNGEPGPVYFENGSFMWDGDPLSYDFTNDVEMKLPNKWAKVIGNIYENPELLKHETP